MGVLVKRLIRWERQGYKRAIRHQWGFRSALATCLCELSGTSLCFLIS